MKKGTQKIKELVIPMLFIVADVIRHFNGPKMYHLKFINESTATVTSTKQLVKIIKNSVKTCLSQIPYRDLITLVTTMKLCNNCLHIYYADCY